MSQPQVDEGYNKDTADTLRYKELFEKLDVNKDGRIEISELSTALAAKKNISNSQAVGHAKKLFKRADSDDSKSLDFSEFVEYMGKHETELKLAFSSLDKNKDGLIEPKEIQIALLDLGIDIDLEEAKRLTKRLDRDGNLKLSYEEWREFLQLYPHTDLEDIVKYWRASLMIDIGDNLTVPPEFTKKEKATGMWWRHLLAGGLAGAVSRTSTAPLDRLKILLQVHGASKNLGIASGFKYMINEGGIKSLWRGNGTNVLKIAPESAIKFAAFEQIKKFVQGDKKSIGVIERFASGASAGAFSQTCIYPLEVIKTRMAVMQSGEFKGILDCGLKIMQKEGFGALYRGYVPNLLGIIPYAGIDLTIYETLKQIYMKKNPEVKEPSVMLLLACGTASSTCGQLASYPLALVRTKLQARVTSHTSFLGLGKHIVENEGLLGLYRGIGPNFMKVLPAVSISYVIYEKAKSQLQVK
ncbi:unnamed protein product [Owenia fusiformis]|uniref:Uncharacterized protein n=1 Tax=Owenia fusiformis TaxID=6347 RepID=A0A8J1TUW8_OWEFU|nr:unnamed protein product [Owenia fusiformis]